MKFKSISIIYLVMLLMWLFPNKLSAQALVGQDDIIKENVVSLLNDYYKNSTFTSDEKSIDVNMILEFKKLFEGEDLARLYNDIEPDYRSGKLLTLDDYTSKLQLAYKSGIKVSMNPSAVVLSMAYPYGKKKTYIVNASVDKMVFGLYQGKTIQDFSGKLFFQITFSMKTGSPTDFKINTIATPDLAKDIVKEAGKVGMLYGLNLSSAYSEIGNEYTNDMNNWSMDGYSSLNYGLEVILPVSPAFRIKSGINMAKYKTLVSIPSSEIQTSESFYDKDGDEYQKITSAAINQVNEIKTLEIPIDAMIVLMAKKKFNIYLSGGVSIAKIRSAYNTVSGDVIIRGYYPAYNVTLYDIPEYGFEQNNYTDQQFDWYVKSTTLMTNYGAGIIFGGKVKMKVGYYFANSGILNNDDTSNFLYSLFGYMGDIRARSNGFTFSLLF